ncbi:hypothetical protein Pmar_PMAR006654 [Perkinsus marinus ATCC 50983]|uniref:Uncharacterized protein n=1 Tax=Perkinsus marinus (strain ATCC 50983 / TXsc) TaxID=423536 RepID=C5LLV9_PERM5|nr:hypothetical protein Pmar_PMAR006654 [Perkinsus marinus ATCC 50983]EER02332.1 hypothetical protein Pmar_PMAR006654 [Perkinsus marinus ATCC 50983]|eukprot:XP_002769614.1 hypothetical protein Pmar_PMAR006654 [Perkinsus marinus ATCC 50983]
MVSLVRSLRCATINGGSAVCMVEGEIREEQLHIQAKMMSTLKRIKSPVLVLIQDQKLA